SGGWFDTTEAMPRIELARSPIPTSANGAVPDNSKARWETAGVLEHYPRSRASTPPPLADGQLFELRLPQPLEAYSIRVIDSAVGRRVRNETRLIERAEHEGQHFGMSRRQRTAGHAATEQVAESLGLMQGEPARNQPGALAEHGIAQDRRRCSGGSRVSCGRMEREQLVGERAELVPDPRPVGGDALLGDKHPAFVGGDADNGRDGTHRAGLKCRARLPRDDVAIDDRSGKGDRHDVAGGACGEELTVVSQELRGAHLAQCREV